MSKMSAQHTPGPWSVLEHSWCETSISAPGFYHAICTLDINHATEDSQESDEAQMAANARLIAAAPDLLEAAEQAQCQCSIRERDSGHRVGCWMPALSAAIAAASGKA